MKALRKLLLNNLGLKVVSLLLAFLLWVQIGGQQMVQRTVAAPVQFINVPPDLEIASDYAHHVQLVVSSDRRSVGTEERQMAVVINLQDSRPGDLVIPLSESNVLNQPAGLEVKQITPARINLRLERTARRIVTVNPLVVGEPADDFEVTDVRVIPSEVVITGPQSDVEAVSSATTESINIQDHNSTLRQAAYLDLENPRLRIENSPSVLVLVTISEKRREVQLRGVPVRVVPEGSRFRPTARSVSVAGSVPVSFRATLSPEMFEAVVDVGDLDAQAQTAEMVPEIVSTEELEGVLQLDSIQPQVVTVRRTR
jgi:YbbR domain-containing protein